MPAPSTWMRSGLVLNTPTTICSWRPGSAYDDPMALGGTVAPLDELSEGIAVALRIARAFARRVAKPHHLDDYEGAALEAVAKAHRSWDPDRGVPFAAWVGLRAKGAVVDEHRRWFGRGGTLHGEEESLDAEDWDSYLEMGGSTDPEGIVVARETALDALRALDRDDLARRNSGRGSVRTAPSTRAVVIGSAIGCSQEEIAAGLCSDSRISQILGQGRSIITEVMA